MKLRFYSLLPALCLFALVSSSSQAQDVPFTIQLESDTNGVVAPNELKHFDLYVVNNSGSEQTLYVTRVANQLPGGAWMSQICTESTCYGPEENNPAPIVMAPKQKTFVQLSILAGSVPNETANVILRFSTGEFSPSVDLNFSVTVATSSVASENRPVVRVSPVPNPASGSTLLPAKVTSTNGLSVRLYDPLGRMAADLTAGAQLNDGGVRVNLDGLAAGTYFYQLDADGYRGTGTLVVSR